MFESVGCGAIADTPPAVWWSGRMFASPLVLKPGPCGIHFRQGKPVSSGNPGSSDFTPFPPGANTSSTSLANGGRVVGDGGTGPMRLVSFVEFSEWRTNANANGAQSRSD